MNRNHPESVRRRVAVPAGAPRGCPPEAARVFTGMGCMHMQTLPVCVPAVWWGVQRAAGGPGRVSKERWENQRVGGENPGPGDSGKSHFSAEHLHFPYKVYVSCFQSGIKTRALLSHLQEVFLSVLNAQFVNILINMWWNKKFWPTWKVQLGQKDVFTTQFEMCCCCKWSYRPCKNMWFNKRSVLFLWDHCSVEALLL